MLCLSITGTPTGSPCIASLTNFDNEGNNQPTTSPARNDGNQPASPTMSGDSQNQARSTSTSGDGCTNRPITEEASNTEPVGVASSTVAIAAGTVGGILGLVVMVTLCVSVAVWLSRHVQVQIHYKGRQRRQETRDGRNEINSEERFVPANLVERQTPDGISRGEQFSG